MQRPTTLATYTLFKASIRCQLTTGAWVRCKLTRRESLGIEYGSTWPTWLTDDYLAFCADIDQALDELSGLGPSPEASKGPGSSPTRTDGRKQDSPS